METIKKYSGLLCLICFFCSAQAQVRNEERIVVEAAKQGVAVDADYFYVINNSSITKHEKESGKKIASWQGEHDGLKHMNAGVILAGKLYCAHSNYPELPMVSSVEIFDTTTLSHIGTYSFGIDYGSLTWIDFKDGQWWAVFAHYNKEGYPHENTWTSLVQFSADWQRLQSWVFPQELIKRFGHMSCSGGLWLPDGKLYITGHDLPELYRLSLPEMGSVLVLDKIYQVPIKGQAIAVDKSKVSPVFYGIDRERKEVVRFELAKP